MHQERPVIVGKEKYPRPARDDAHEPLLKWDKEKPQPWEGGLKVNE